MNIFIVATNAMHTTPRTQRALTDKMEERTQNGPGKLMNSCVSHIYFMKLLSAIFYVSDFIVANFNVNDISQALIIKHSTEST